VPDPRLIRPAVRTRAANRAAKFFYVERRFIFLRFREIHHTMGFAQTNGCLVRADSNRDDAKNTMATTQEER